MSTNRTNSFLKYIHKNPLVLDVFADYHETEDGVRIITGAVVACDDGTFDALMKHCNRYYPDQTLVRMTNTQYVLHTSKEVH